MNSITVNASKQYHVVIDNGLLSKLGSWVATLKKGCRVAVISDSNVWPLYGNQAISSLKESGYDPISFIFPAGEEQKNANTFLNILNFFALNRLTRSDIVIALGGGVVGDITGFAAACYLRGIQYIQVPTTLLAMVDSSVGGKTAIDLPAGKNLVGAFYQPALVLCDTSTLSTLPTDVFRDGCAEVIKYGILYDAELFQHLKVNTMNFDRHYVIARCVELKRNVVMEDEFDKGSRQMLNLGHTIGHGVEACSNYSISHGKAVAIGTAIIARASGFAGICEQQDCDAIIEIFNAFNLPTKTVFSSKQLRDSALSDKKRFGDIVNLIVPKKVGECMILPVHVDNIEAFIEAGL